MPLESNGLPGVSSARTATYRRVFKSGPERFVASSYVIDGTKSRDAGNTGDLDVLRAGKLLGKITSGGKYAPSIFGVTTVAYADGDLTITAAAATITEIIRRVGATGTVNLVGPATANGVVVKTAVAYTGSSATTLVVPDLNVNAISGSFLVPNDGSENPILFVPDGYGLKVTDEFGSSQDTPIGEYPIEGDIDSSQLVDWPSDTSLQSWIVARLNDVPGARFNFDHIR